MNWQLLVSYWTHLPVSQVKIGVAVLGVGLAISIFCQVIKHVKGIDSVAVNRAIVSGVSFVVSTAYYILQTPSADLTMIFGNAALLLGAAHITYWVSVSPFYNWFMKLLSDAATYRQMSAPQNVAPGQPSQFAE